jgi:hypothetical protein
MSLSNLSAAPRRLACAAFAGAIAVVLAPRSDAQRLTQPVYRVAATPTAGTTPTADSGFGATPAGEQPIVSPPAVVPSIDRQVKPASAIAPAGPFDLTQQPGEHPLGPCMRLAKSALADIDAKLLDYSAKFTKVERINGDLSDPQQLELRVRHQPFSVYMRFITPNPGQEALYVANQNNGKLVAMGSGWQRRLGPLNLDPEGTLAMRNQRYPITKAGLRNLTSELIQVAEADSKYAECEVTYNDGVKVDGRPATMIEATHPVPRKNFKYHKARIFIDHEHRLPVAYEAYSWPAVAGGEPILEERYIYTNLKLNNGFTDADFSTENPAMFK